MTPAGRATLNWMCAWRFGNDSGIRPADNMASPTRTFGTLNCVVMLENLSGKVEQQNFAILRCPDRQRIFRADGGSVSLLQLQTIQLHSAFSNL